MENITLKIEGMSCEGCVKNARKALLAVDGVSSVDIVLEGGKCTVDFNPDIAKPDDLRTAIEDAGFDVAA